MPGHQMWYLLTTDKANHWLRPTPCRKLEYRSHAVIRGSKIFHGSQSKSLNYVHHASTTAYRLAFIQTVNCGDAWTQATATQLVIVSCLKNTHNYLHNQQKPTENRIHDEYFCLVSTGPRFSGIYRRRQRKGNNSSIQKLCDESTFSPPKVLAIF